MDDQQLREQLVHRYLANTASKEELALFFHLLQKGELDKYLEKIPLPITNVTPVIPTEQSDKKLEKSHKILRYAVAASLILSLSTAALFLLNNKLETRNLQVVVQSIPQALPGTKKAILTLSNGQTILLHALQQTIQEGATSITPGNDALVYKAAKPSATTLYNTITTPNGGEYKVILPDGSIVWLNAATVLRYPTAFNGTERRVELKGEAYFEVAKNAAQPFIVKSGDAEIRVIGTHFNVMAYEGEGYLKTTLAEGAVALQAAGHEEILKPGQGGIIKSGSAAILVATADVEQDLAWKNGVFYFNKTEMAVIMKQLARWYDLEIRYSGAIPQKRFVGRISRNTNLSEVLDVLRLSDVKFSMTGKNLVVEE